MIFSAKYRNILLLLFVLVNFEIVSFGQTNSLANYKSKLDQCYGYDIDLYNGAYYVHEKNIVTGTPFWNEDTTLIGDIFYNGKAYTGLRLGYNIKSQEFIHIFNDRIGAKRIIILDTYKIDSVKVGENLFISNPFAEIDNRFVQLVYKGNISCVISWSVERNFKSTGDKPGYRYLKSKYEIFVLINDVLYLINRRNDLISLLPGNAKIEINNYLKLNRIRWRKMDSKMLNGLISECDAYFN